MYHLDARFFVVTPKEVSVMATKVATIREIREIEAAADRKALSYASMMQRAGEAASQLLRQRVLISPKTRIAFLVGPGDNGGDGLVMAADLARNSEAHIIVYMLGDRSPDDVHLQAVRACQAAVIRASDDAGHEGLAQLIRNSDVIVDALFGIGLRLPLRPQAARLLQIVRQNLNAEAAESDDIRPLGATECLRPASPEGRFILALDCPSGVDCDTGAADPQTLFADATLTFIAAKPGLFTFPAAAHVGELHVASAGVPNDLPELYAVSAEVIDGRAARTLLPRRPLDGHKGTFGKAMLVAGSRNYIGALAFAGEAACRSGAGLVSIATTAALIEIAAGQLREPTWLPLADNDGAIAAKAWETVATAAPGFNALLIGCGLGLHAETRAFLARLIQADRLPPLVLDADALNILSELPNWWAGMPAGCVITPHSGEMARLSGMTTAEINGNRWATARDYAAKWNVVVLLKGAHTVIAAPDGRISVIPFKTDALGTAGTGDVLAGMIAGLRAQGLAGYDSARLGAFVHGLAGVRAVSTVGSSRSVIAGDVLREVGGAFKAIETV